MESTNTAIEDAIDACAASAGAWSELGVEQKLDLLRVLHDRVGAAAERWVNTALEIKGVDSSSPLAGEEWMSGPYAALIWLEAAAETLEAVASGADIVPSRRIKEDSGRTKVTVYPGNTIERILLSGSRAEVWMSPGVRPADVNRSAARLHRDPTGHHGVCAVMGAGNITAIAPLDLLHKLFVEGEVAIVKLNPVLADLQPVFENVFEPLINAGYARFVAGGAEEGSALVQDPRVDSVHITGSARTHDAIVFGTGEQGQARKAACQPILTKPITSELGGVGATIVVPGPWTKADLTFQAEHIASQKLHNSGFNCIAAQILVLPEEWDASDKLVDKVRAALTAAPSRPAYYPGSADRQRAAVAQRESAEVLDQSSGRTLITDIDPASDSACLHEEFFAPVLGITQLPGADATSFLEAAVRFANDKVEGTLGVNLLIHPRTMKQLGDGLDHAITQLRYGTVAVNTWSGLGFLLARAAWGAAPGHTIDNVGSGIGFVHNALMLDRPAKTVVYGPFRPFPRTLISGHPHLSPRPPWFVTSRTADTTGRRLTAFAADGRIRRLPGVFAAALRG